MLDGLGKIIYSNLVRNNLARGPPLYTRKILTTWYENSNIMRRSFFGRSIL